MEVERGPLRCQDVAVYRERRSRITGAVAWTSTAAGDTDVRVLPDGCIDLIWNGDELFVAGPDTQAHVLPHAAGTRLVAVRFAPGFGRRVVGIPASDLTDQRVPIDDLWAGPEVRQLGELLSSAHDPSAVIETIERVALDRSRTNGDGGLVDHVVAMARRGHGVAEIARVVGLSDRQLQRHCLDAFGYGAKTLAKILRMTRALSLARDGHAFADTAITSGYSDQAHLSRDVKQLTGLTLGQLVG
jgi:AraC-like DNA-binding protein